MTAGHSAGHAFRYACPGGTLCAVCGIDHRGEPSSVSGHEWDEPDDNGERGHSVDCWCREFLTFPRVIPEADRKPVTDDEY